MNAYRKYLWIAILFGVLSMVVVAKAQNNNTSRLFLPIIVSQGTDSENGFAANVLEPPPPTTDFRPNFGTTEFGCCIDGYRYIRHHLTWKEERVQEFRNRPNVTFELDIRMNQSGTLYEPGTWAEDFVSFTMEPDALSYEDSRATDNPNELSFTVGSLDASLIQANQEYIITILVDGGHSREDNAKLTASLGWRFLSKDSAFCLANPELCVDDLDHWGIIPAWDIHIPKEEELPKVYSWNTESVEVWGKVVDFAGNSVPDAQVTAKHNSVILSGNVTNSRGEYYLNVSGPVEIVASKDGLYGTTNVWIDPQKPETTIIPNVVVYPAVCPPPPGTALSASNTITCDPTATPDPNATPKPTPTQYPSGNLQPPALVAPTDNATVQSHDVTFKWDLSSSVPDVYILRVVDDPNKIDTGPWLIDQGVNAPATELTVTLPNDKVEFWWSVWLCTGCTTGNPVTHRGEVWRFTYEPEPSIPPGIRLCNGTNYSGTCESFPEGEYPDLDQYGVADWVESVKFDDSYELNTDVWLWREDNFSGETIHTTASLGSLGNLANHVRSMKIDVREPTTSFCTDLPDGVTLFSDVNYGGDQSPTFTTNVSYLGNNIGWNDRAQSVRLCGYCVRLWTDADYKGTHTEECSGGSDPNLSDDAVGGASASSLEVWSMPATPTPVPATTTPTPMLTSTPTPSATTTLTPTPPPTVIPLPTPTDTPVPTPTEVPGVSLTVSSQKISNSDGVIVTITAELTCDVNNCAQIFYSTAGQEGPFTEYTAPFVAVEEHYPPCTSFDKNYDVRVWAYGVDSAGNQIGGIPGELYVSLHIGHTHICNGGSPTLTPALTPVPTNTPAPTSIPTPTSTIVPSHTPTSTPMPTNTPEPTATSTPTSEMSGIELLTSPWHLVGNNGASEAYQSILANALQGKDMLRITYDLHGLQALGGDASAIIFDQNGWQYVSLSDYGQSGFDGQQTVDIPLSDFTGLDLNQLVGTLHTRFWYGSAFTVDIYSVVAYSSQSPTPLPTVTPTPLSTNTPIPISTSTPTDSTSGVELLTDSWHLSGNNGASEKYQGIPSDALNGMSTLRITYDLHGLNALGGDASAIIFDQNGWQYISLSNYGQNGLDGQQTVDIPLSDFTGLDLNQLVGTLHTRFWYGSAFTVDIYSIEIYDSTTSTPTPAPTATPEQPGGEATLYLSTDWYSSVSGIEFNPEDVLRYDLALDSWSLHFDGYSLDWEDVNALHQLNDGTWLISFDWSTYLSGIGWVRNEDILRFDPATGSLTLYLDGSAVDLDENIDAIAIANDGSLILSTTSTYSGNGITARDEDLFQVHDGSFSLYFDASDIGVTADIVGAHVDESGNIYFATNSSYDIGATQSDESDVIRCVPSSLGNTTACNLTLWWDGSQAGLTEELDGLFIETADVQAASQSDTVTKLVEIHEFYLPLVQQ